MRREFLIIFILGMVLIGCSAKFSLVGTYLPEEGEEMS